MKSRKLLSIISFVLCYSILTAAIGYADVQKVYIDEYANQKQHFTYVDLTGVANRGFADDAAGDGKGGWSDQGPNNDMSSFTLTGINDLNGIYFDIIDPRLNNGNSVLVLRGQKDPHVPLEATIPVNKKAKGIYFLHSSPFLGTNHPDLGQYILEYDDGTTETFELVNNKQIFTWWGTDFKAEGPVAVVWRGQNDSSPINLSAYALENPHPDKTIKNIIAKSYGEYGYLCLMAITLTDNGPFLPIEREKNIGNPDTSDWFEYEPCEYPDSIAGSPIDMSYLLDAPAGKHGYLNVDGDKLYFDDGTPFKIWGVNLTTSLNSYDDARDYAKKIAQLGFNCVRFHFVAVGETGTGMTSIDSATRRSDMLSPKWMDLWCYMLNELKQRGVYSIIPLAQYNTILTNDNLQDKDKWPDGQGNAKFFDPDMQAKVKKQYDDILGYVNPYTGIKIGDDPANVIGTFFNESSLYAADNFESWDYYYPIMNELYNEWLRKKYPTRDALKKAWTEFDTGKCSLGDDEDQFEGTVKLLSYSSSRQLDSGRYLDNNIFLGDLQSNSYAKWCEDVRQQGYKMLLAGSATCLKGKNDTAYSYANLIGSDVMMYQDYHYLASGNGERVQKGTKLTTAVDSILNSLSGYNTLSRQAVKCFYGKPHLITEWDAGVINPYASEMFLITPAIACLQGWGPFLFSWKGGFFSNRRVLEPEEKFISNTHEILNRPVTQAQLIMCALMVLRQDVKEADKGFYWNRFQTNEAYEKKNQTIKYSNTFFIGKTGTFADDYMYDRDYNDNTVLKLTNMGDKTGVYTSITNEIQANSNNLVFKVNTQRTQAAAGFLGKVDVELDDVIFDIENEFATVYLSSLTQDSIRESDHLILTLAGDQKNKGLILTDTASEVIDGGTGPVMIEQIKGKVILKSYDDFEVYSLDWEGRRKNKLNVRKTSKGFTEITTTRDDKSLHYEIIRTKKSNNKFNGEKTDFLKELPGDCFDDLGEWEYAKNKIERTYLEGFIKEVSDRKFDPSGSISRGQFVSMLVDALKLQSSAEDFNLADVSITHNYYKNIKIAHCLGIALGDAENKFRPDDPLTKQDLIVMTSRALDRTLKMKKEAEGVNVNTFSDFSSVDDYAKDAVKRIIELGYFVPQNAIMPHQEAARAEAAIVIYNLRWE